MPSLLRDPDFRRLWTVSLSVYFVRWLEVLVFGIFTYEQTGSAFTVASMMMLRMLPLALFGVPFGAWAARIRRRTGLLVMLGLLAATALALLALAATGQLRVWHVAIASFVNGVAWSADNALRRSLVGDLAGPGRAGKGMALDVGASNVSRLVGPGIGGLLLAHHGMPAVLGLVAALHLLSLARMLKVNDPGVPDAMPWPGLLATLAVGLRTARASPRLVGTLWITVLFNLFMWPVLSMVPVIGRDRLGLAPDGVGLLASVDGVGTLLGALVLATLSRPALYGRLFVGGTVLFCTMLPVFALSTQVHWAALALFALGFGQAAFAVMQATLTFLTAPPDRRPQAMGLLTTCMGTGPIGFLLVGALADRIGAPWAALASAGAGLLMLAASWPLWRACWQDDRSSPG
jgi:MFS family permease